MTAHDPEYEKPCTQEECDGVMYNSLLYGWHCPTCGYEPTREERRAAELTDARRAAMKDPICPTCGLGKKAHMTGRKQDDQYDLVNYEDGTVEFVCLRSTYHKRRYEGMKKKAQEERKQAAADAEANMSFEERMWGGSIFGMGRRATEEHEKNEYPLVEGNDEGITNIVDAMLDEAVGHHVVKEDDDT